MSARHVKKAKAVQPKYAYYWNRHIERLYRFKGGGFVEGYLEPGGWQASTYSLRDIESWPFQEVSEGWAKHHFPKAI